jgi:hypothetical protein
VTVAAFLFGVSFGLLIATALMALALAVMLRTPDTFDMLKVALKAWELACQPSGRQVDTPAGSGTTAGIGYAGLTRHGVPAIAVFVGRGREAWRVTNWATENLGVIFDDERKP